VGIEGKRRQIDAIDREILRLLGERLDVARHIGKEKRARGADSYDPVREREVLDGILRQAGGHFPVEGLRAIYQQIISASRSLESDLPVLYLGSPGSLTHHAARTRFGEAARLSACDGPERIFEQIERGAVEYAVLTLEASSMEAHLDRLDLFLHSPAQIFGEFHIVPRLGLYGAAATAPAQTIHAHPAALAGASRWVERATQDHRFLAVGTPQEAAERAGAGGDLALGYPVLEGWGPLTLVRGDLEDEPKLTRRFLILGRRDGAATGADKTSLLAVIPNRPGALMAVTSVLARHEVNLCWIEPKGTPIGSWDHLFFLDLEGHRQEPAVAQAIEELRAHTEYLKVLGSYPSERPPGRSFG
jgi:chorismate mutase/prephenate dehydratase